MVSVQIRILQRYVPLPTHDYFWILVVHSSRLLWREILPLASSTEDAPWSRFMALVLRMLPDLKQGKVKDSTEFQKDMVSYFDNIRSDIALKFHQRSWKHVPRSRFPRMPSQHIRRVPIYLATNPCCYFEYNWEERLIAWEHSLIRAQSLAAYFATLGGGFHMCHHWQTATKLAALQRQMAYILQDNAMVQKCIINESYNHIYAGRFDVAQELLDGVECHQDPVLINMVDSARLLMQRVRDHQHWSHKPKIVDDFARIRMIDDHSTGKDWDPIAPKVAVFQTIQNL